MMAETHLDSASDIYDRAIEARDRRQLADALQLFQQALSDPWGGLTAKQRRMSHLWSLKCSLRLGLWGETEVMARRAITEFPRLGGAYQGLAEAQLQLGLRDEAHANLLAALELDPQLDGARALLLALRSEPVAASSSRPRSWPKRQASFADPSELVRRYMLRDRPRRAFVRPETVFMTLGSCFAQNLAERLQQAGHAAHFESIGEEANTTFANRYLVEWIENGVVDAQTAVMDEAFGEARRQRLRRNLEACDVFVMTLGVAAAFFDDEGEYVHVSQRNQADVRAHGRLTMRTCGVAENVDNIERILDAVRRLCRPGVRFVLTVSPVPMAGTTEFESAITADCLSKATLRVACHEVVARRGPGEVIYWPSFEMVRWLGPHFGPGAEPAYGADDGNTRHVSKWLVDLIVSLFLEFHAEPAPT